MRKLLDAVAQSKKPCMSIMNMPPLAYMRRLPGLDADTLKPAYTDASVWDNFDPERVTLCSPDPQAIRPPDEAVNVLMVTLPTNFKVAKIQGPGGRALLEEAREEDIDSRPASTPEGKIELPVKASRVRNNCSCRSLSGRPLLTSNYRCVTPDSACARRRRRCTTTSGAPRSVYNFVFDLLP